MNDIVMPEQLKRSAYTEITDELLAGRFEWLCEFQELNWFVPSYTIMGVGWGNLTRAAVPRTLDLLETKGLIRRVNTPGGPQVILVGCLEVLGSEQRGSNESPA